MAARRGGFGEFFEPLYEIKKYKTGLLDGTLSGVWFFSKQILPLVKSFQAKDKFAVAKIVKEYSPLISNDTLKNSKSSLKEIRRADKAVKSLFSLWDNNSDPLLIDSLKSVAGSGLFEIPEIFLPIISLSESSWNEGTPVELDQSRDSNPEIDAWSKALSVPFSQLESYVKYISDESPFGTHQGIKGLQFPRVMVVLDDNEARGFMFSYDKLLGAKAPTTRDIKSEKEGKETSNDRTRRLFYVTCSRAQSSLAVVVYTKETDKIKGFLQNKKWFDDNEIIEM